MSLQPKTKRRLLILVGLALIVAVGAFWALRGPSARTSAATIELGRSGMAAYAQGDYLAAMPKLSEYLAAVKISSKDPSGEELDALAAFGDCRRRFPLAKRKHLEEAHNAFDRYLAFRPDDVKVLKLQVKVLSRAGRPEETIAQANRLLKLEPNNREALYIRANAMFMQPKPNLPEVEKAVAELLKEDPGHSGGLRLSQLVRAQQGASPKDLIAVAEEWANKANDDPRYELAAARTYHNLVVGEAGKRDALARGEWNRKGRQWLLKAAARPPIDPYFAREVVALLDRNSLFYESIDYLKLALEAVKDDEDGNRAELEGSLVRRLWQNAMYAQVVERTAHVQPQDNMASADLLGYRAMALKTQAAMPSAGEERTRLLNAVDPIVTALRNRTDSAEAQAWAMLLKMDTSPDRKSTLESIRRCREAREKDPSNVVATVMLGDAYADQGETESAVREWETATGQAPDWGYPHARLAMVNLTDGRFEEAERRAFAAYERSKTNRQFIALHTQVRYAALPKNPNPAALASMLGEVERIQSAFPNDPGTLALNVILLARVKGEAAASERLKGVLDAKLSLPIETLLQLQAADDTYRLGQAEKLAAVIAQTGGTALPQAVRTAKALLDSGKAQEGLKTLEEARQQARGSQAMNWLLAIASFREQAGDPEAEKAWVELAGLTQDDLFFQTQVLKSTIRFKNRELWRSAIERVKALTGDDGSLWKMERSRWLLANSDSEKDRSEAIALLRELSLKNRGSAEVRRLLGLALARDGNYRKASEELAAALLMAPTRGDIGLELVQALRAVPNLNDARARLAEVATIPSLSPEQRMRVSNYFEEMGQPELAIRTLLAMPEGSERDARLGMLYASTGPLSEAQAAFKRVLNDPAARPQDLYSGADFYAATGDEAQAKSFLDRLLGMPPSSVTELLIGQYHDLYGQAPDALAHLTKATQLEPKEPRGWRALAAFHLRSRKYDDALKAVDTGLAAAGSDAELAALKPVIVTVRKLTDVEPVRLLVNELSRNPTSEAGVAMLNILVDGQARARDAAPEAKAAVARDVRQKLTALADTHRGHWLLQQTVIRYHLNANQPAQAAELAERAITAFPSRPDAPQMAAEANIQLQRWDKVIEAATVWRQRSGADPMAADIAMASAMTAKRQPAVAVRALEAHVKNNPLPPALADGASLEPRLLLLYRSYGRALVEQGRVTEATERLSPLLGLGVDARSAWLTLASAFKQEDQATQWIDQARAKFPEKLTVLDHLVLADACFQAGRATSSSALLDRAMKTLEPLLAGDKPVIEAVVLAAQTAHYQADYPKAATYWRAVMAAQASPEVANNLAYALVLWGKPEALTEGRRLAEGAVAADPENPQFLGTLARACSRQGDRAKAIELFRKTLKLDPQSAEAMVGLAEELAKGSANEKFEARQLLTNTRLWLSQNPQSNDPELKRQFDVVQAAIQPADGR